MSFFKYFAIMGKFLSIVCNEIYCVAAGINTLMSISDGLGLYIFRRKMEKTRLMREEVDEKVLFFRQSRNFFLYS